MPSILIKLRARPLFCGCAMGYDNTIIVIKFSELRTVLTISVCGGVVEPEPRAKEPKLNYPRLLSIYHRLEVIVKKKIMVAEKVLLIVTIFNFFTLVKSKNGEPVSEPEPK
jgi:hypothetical protein